MADAGESLPVPSAPEITEAHNTARSVYKEELAQSSPAERAALARKLLDAGREPRQSAAERYAVLLLACEVATKAGEVDVALDAIEALHGAFRGIDQLKLTGDLVVNVRPARAGEENRPLLLRLQGAAEQAMLADRYDVVLRIVTGMTVVARRSELPELLRLANEFASEMSSMEKAYRGVAWARETLAKKPTDPPANAALGRFMCLSKGDWQAGLPLLAAGNDPKLKALAQKDLEGGLFVEAQVAIADLWFDAAEKNATPLARQRMLSRAAKWYQEALPKAEGLAKTRVNKRIEALERAGVLPRKALDLLAMVDIKKDVIFGNWARNRDGELVLRHTRPFARVEIPYRPPEEYDVRVKFTRLDNQGVLALLCSKGEANAFSWIVGARNKRCGLELVQSKFAVDNPTTVVFEIQPDKQYETVVQVRRGGVRAFIDGKKLVDYKTDFRDMQIHNEWRLRNDGVVGIGMWGGKYTVHAMEIIDVTGVGRKLSKPAEP